MIYQSLLFSKDECNRIIEYHKTYQTTDDYFSGTDFILNNNHIKFGTTSYDVFVIRRDDNTSWLFNKILNWFIDVSGILFDDIIVPDSCTLHCYNVGESFPLHVDLNSHFPNRLYNLGIQLNDDYMGGEYVCFNENGDEIVLSNQVGNSIAYHCKVPHEIRKITHGNRWSIVMPINRNKSTHITTII